MIVDRLKALSIRKRLVILVCMCIVMMLAGGVIGLTSLSMLAQNGVHIKEKSDRLVEAVKENSERARFVSDLQASIDAFIKNPDEEYLKRVKSAIDSMKGILAEDHNRLKKIIQLDESIKHLSVRQASFKSNMKAASSAFEAIQEKMAELNKGCNADICKQILTDSLDTLKLLTPMLNRISDVMSSVQAKKKAMDVVSGVVEEHAAKLEDYATRLDSGERQLVLDLQGAYYDLDDAVSSAVSIGLKVVRVKADIERVLNGLKSHILSSLDTSSAREMSELVNKGLSLSKNISYFLASGISAGVIFLIVIAYLFIVSITRPLDDLRRLIMHMSGGDLTGRLTVVGRDEIAEISTAMNGFLEKFGEIIARAAQTSRGLDEKSEVLAALSNQMMGEAQRSVSASKDAASAAEDLLRFMEETREQMNSLLEATNEIASNTMTTASLANGLSEQMDESSSVIAELDRYANQVGEVTRVIRGITDQTTLLALNATIEAARAGEAGKGFAVVAEEVKELARQTQEATERIAPLIDSIQTNVKRAVGVIAKSNKAASEINEAINSVASAAEEQTATYQEMNSQLESGVSLTEGIKDRVDLLEKEAEQNLDESMQLQDISTEIRGNSSILKEVITGFRY